MRNKDESGHAAVSVRTPSPAHIIGNVGQPPHPRVIVALSHCLAASLASRCHILFSVVPCMCACERTGE